MYYRHTPDMATKWQTRLSVENRVFEVLGVLFQSLNYRSAVADIPAA